jgi:hypothetical protein
MRDAIAEMAHNRTRISRARRILVMAASKNVLMLPQSSKFSMLLG